MQRQLIKQLKAWQQQSEPIPILLRGARQVGKTHLVEYFGRTCFTHSLTINLEQAPEYQACFDTLKPTDILNKIELLSHQTIIPGTTLLFLDEIQACPNAIMALRYFKEQIPKLHVIGAGSLLEFALRAEGFSMPVGRVQYLYLTPLSFTEYLQAKGANKLLEALEQIALDSPFSKVLHQQAMKWVREYMVIGGMPMAVSRYLQNASATECQQIQTLLLNTYQDDFAKYAASSQHKYLQQVYLRTPGLVGQQIKYSNISTEYHSRFIKSAISDLSKAGVVFPVYATLAAGLPLHAHINEKKFKLLFLDVGLLKRSMKIDLEVLLSEDLLLVNRGAMAEQFVGQELLAYQAPFEQPQLHYWCRDKKSSMAEVDYLISVGTQLLPIEVKSGKTGTLKSLRLLMEEKQLPVGVRISEKPLGFSNGVLSVPLYLVSQLTRLASAALAR